MIIIIINKSSGKYEANTLVILFILFYLCPALTAIELYIDPVESSLEFRSTAWFLRLKGL